MHTGDLPVNGNAVLEKWLTTMDIVQVLGLSFVVFLDEDDVLDSGIDLKKKIFLKEKK